jgi:hypothetical protein
MSSAEQANNRVKGSSPLGKCAPPGTFVKDGKIYYKTCPDKYDGPTDRIHFDYTKVNHKEYTYVEMEDIPFDDTPEGGLARQNRFHYNMINGIKPVPNAAMQQRINNMVARLTSQHNQAFNINIPTPTAKADTKPEASVQEEQKLVSIFDILKRLADNAPDDTPPALTGKRKIDDTGLDYILPQVDITTGLSHKDLSKAKMLYTKIIIEKDSWPKWTREWFGNQANDMSRALSSGSITKYQYNTLHKTHAKLGYSLLHSKDTRINPVTTKVIKHHHDIKRVQTPNIWSRCSDIARRRKRYRRLCLLNNKYTSSSLTTLIPLLRKRPEYAPSLLGIPYKMKNIKITRVVNSRRESWKRRKRKEGDAL